MFGGEFGLIEGDKDTFRPWRKLPLAQLVFGEEEKATESVFWLEVWVLVCGREESRRTVLKGLKGKVSTGPKVMVRC